MYLQRETWQRSKFTWIHKATIHINGLTSPATISGLRNLYLPTVGVENRVVR